MYGSEQTMHGTPAFRKWQVEASDAVRIEWRNANSKPLTAATPGAGKTLFGGAMGKLAIEDFGCGMILCVSPTINVKENWEQEGFAPFGLNAAAKVGNQTLKERLTYGESLIADRNAICVTYAQLARGKDLFAEMLRRYSGLLIADEPHHADEKAAYGEALNLAAESAKLRLALTGTPFNTRGTPLAMIESEELMLPDGTRVRRSIPTYEYSYGDAIRDRVCRQVEFVTVMGRGEVTYQSLLQPKTWKKVIDLANRNKSDRLTHLLAPEGNFLVEMLETGIRSLMDIKQSDKGAAMLVAVQDINEGKAVGDLLERHILPNHPEWARLQVVKIFHDTPGASDRITDLRHDHTDIVIAVRMISEGVNIPRLRVGVYASNFLTRLFFIQLIGRFIRYEARLDELQFAKVIIPAHVSLLEWAREIEAMIAEAIIPEDGDGGGGDPGEPNEIVGRITDATAKGAILRGEHEEDITMAGELYRRVPMAVGRVPDLLATQIARAFLQGGEVTAAAQSNFAPTTPKILVPNNKSARAVNSDLGRRVARLLTPDGKPDGKVFEFVNGRANQAAGIRGVDDLTTAEEFERRAEFLRAWLASLYQGGAL